LNGSRISAGLPPSMPVWMSHGDSVRRLPDGFATLATTASCPVAAAGDEARGFYGVQFHPEVTHTPNGNKLLANFVHQVCGCGDDWTMGSFVELAIAQVREQVGDGREGEGENECGGKSLRAHCG
ncbi:MAG: hypothetical protein K8I65_08565, partial [Thermoanaerobaculia bacterium]|nr:hypothetical protein [Thermoanaerobaculia bacterium]